MKTEKKFNAIGYGLVPGILLPFITLIIIWSVKYHGGFFDFLVLFQQLGMLAKIVSLVSLSNLILFFLFIWSKRSFSARGVIFATLVIAFAVLVLKFA